MSDICIIVPHLIDAAVFSTRLREADHAEITALGLEPEPALDYCIRNAVWARAAFVNALPAALWGVGAETLAGQTGVVWAMTTPLIEQHKRRFMAESRCFVDFALTIFPHLESWTDARYTRALRWLRWLGFTIGEPTPVAPHGNLFCHAQRWR